MGLLDPAEWKAKWIAGNYVPKKDRYPSDYFRKTFTLNEQVKKARLYITACGLYEASINGHRVGTQCFTPGSTEYNKRLQYQTYDVAELLRDGMNAMAVVLGDGWFRGQVGPFGSRRVFGAETKLLAQLEITTLSGEQITVVTDDSFTWSNVGAIRENDLQVGEVYDAAMALTGYDTPEFEDCSKFGPVKLTEYHTRLVCSNNVPVMEREHFKPKLIKTPSGETVLDFGQNMAGYPAFSVSGPKGHAIILQMAEVLDEDGNFTVRNLVGNKLDFQIIRYICSGNGKEYYKPKFAIQGFRYVLVKNWPGELNPDDFEAIAVYSAMEKTGDFTCSHPLVNRLVENARWSMKSNFLEVPTDCPTRERAGWTGDAQLFFETGSYFMDVAPLYRKYLMDIADCQGKDGKVPCIVPDVGSKVVSMLDGAVGWADAIILIPYRYWKIYGDKDIIKVNYPAMKKYAGFIIDRATKNRLFSRFKKNPYRQYTYEVGFHWGEWLEPMENLSLKLLMKPKREEATAYFSYTMSCLAEIADEIGETADAKQYRTCAEGAKKAYNYLYVKDNDIVADRPAKYVRPLAFGLLPEEARKNVAASLLADTKARNYTIGTGFLSTPFILPVLTEFGYIDDAYQMLEQEEIPGWLYQVKTGATTIWEKWDAIDKNGKVKFASHNHYSYGAVCNWLFRDVCGIRLSDGDEYNYVIVPHPGGDLTYANASFRSIWGEVRSNWEIREDKVHYTIQIPANTTAKLVLPVSADKGFQIIQGKDGFDDGQWTLGSGTYEFVTEK